MYFISKKQLAELKSHIKQQREAQHSLSASLFEIQNMTFLGPLDDEDAKKLQSGSEELESLEIEVRELNTIMHEHNMLRSRLNSKNSKELTESERTMIQIHTILCDNQNLIEYVLDPENPFDEESKEEQEEISEIDQNRLDIIEALRI